MSVRKRGDGEIVPDPRQLELPIGGTAEEKRAAAIVATLEDLSGEEVFVAFAELDELPPEVVRAALAPSTGPAPAPETFDEATRRAHGFPSKALRLRTVALVRDADIFDLGSLVEEQVRIAGTTWDGLELAAEERLDGENEGSFAGTLERRVLVDADASEELPLFDVVLFAEGAGAIFRADSTELVGAVADGIVELKDRRARAAIQEALAVSAAELEASLAAITARSPAVRSTLTAASRVAPPELNGEKHRRASLVTTIASSRAARKAVGANAAAKKTAPPKKTGASAKKTSERATKATAKKVSAKHITPKTSSSKAAPSGKASSKTSSGRSVDVAAKKVSAKQGASRSSPSSTEKTSSKAAPSTSKKTSSERTPTSKKTSSKAAPSTSKKTSSGRAPSTSKKTSSKAAPSTSKKTSSKAAPSTSKKTSSGRAPSTSKKTSSKKAPSAAKKTSSGRAPSAAKKTSSKKAPSAAKKTSSRK